MRSAHSVGRKEPEGQETFRLLSVFEPVHDLGKEIIIHYRQRKTDMEADFNNFIRQNP